MTTESDRELLELAAKAAGLRVTWEPVHSCYWVDLGQGLVHEPWEPLKNDGQTLRLESSLSLDVRWQGQHVIVGRTYGDAWQEPFYLHGGDKLAARRYAAVRAAAAIARATHKEGA